MDYDFNLVPVGESCFVENSDFAMVVFERLSERKGLFEHCDPSSGRSVLKFELNMDGHCEITYIDRHYWTITINGMPVRPDQPLEGSFDVNDKDRTIELYKPKNNYIF